MTAKRKPRLRAVPDPFATTQEELDETVTLLDKLVTHFYWLCFRNEIGHKCHPFLEFSGLMQQYVQICRQASRKGQDFTKSSIHTNVAMPMNADEAEYLAEKLNCIFGPAIRQNPEVAQILRKRLGL